MTLRKAPDGFRWVVCDAGKWHLVPLPTPEASAAALAASAHRWAVLQEAQACLDDEEEDCDRLDRVITALLEIT